MLQFGRSRFLVNGNACMHRPLSSTQSVTMKVCNGLLLSLVSSSLSVLLQSSFAWVAVPRTSVVISKKSKSHWSSYSNVRLSLSFDNSEPKQQSQQQLEQQQGTVELIKEEEKSQINMAVKVIGSSTSFVVSGLFFAVLAWRRDALVVSFFIGSIVNAILSKILKKIINQTRPLELDDDNHPGDKGMPSSHAMSLGFIATFVALEYPIVQIPSVIYTIVSLWYRIQVKLHTWQQIVVGAVLGSLHGWIWFHLCHGDNPWNIHIMDMVTKYFLVEGVLPIPLLAVPLLIGAATIGSFTRRIRRFMKDGIKMQ